MLLSGSQARSLGAAILEVARELSRSIPSPRAAPYFGVDQLGGGVELLDHLTTRGIFRTYEFVLDLSPGLGSSARWLSRSYGARIIGVRPSRDVAEVASLLTRRVGLQEKICFCVADLGILPFEARVFTHLWSTETLQPLPDKVTFFRAAFEVLRPGGSLALQEVIPSAGAPYRGWLSSRAYCETLCQAGFASVEAHEVTPMGKEGPPSFRFAQSRLRGLLQKRLGQDEEARRLYDWLFGLWEARRKGTLRTFHFFARRPA